MPARHRHGDIGAFLLRERRAPNPLYDLRIAGRRVFWLAACAEVIVFGTLMGAMFGQRFLQNVLGYSTLEAGASILRRIARRRRGGGQQATVGPGAGRVPSGLDGMAAPLARHDARLRRLPQSRAAA
jgi:hypothetical protein